ncbi:MAG TPA: Gfo/Idh/MocA family oxidoreductase [Bryobacteraceae bacterium]|nr:Gfo/Idh/MocA family oxidoreductase [Bryobacteraceae bacterium]
MSKIRYAVMGIGHIAQAAVLPAFEHAENSKLGALISGDPVKMKELGEKYQVPAFPYERYEEALSLVDAVYIATPNSLHLEHTTLAAVAGKHVLCEKPMAVTAEDCAGMIRVCEEHDVKLMIAYRLHFEEANLSAIDTVKSGQIGQIRAFHSVFGFQVKPGNVRVQAAKGGGPVYDIGVYCINAARYLFQDEPIEVSAFSAKISDGRFSEVDEMTSALLRFPKDRLASFTCSFGSANIGYYTILGTEGSLRVDPAYEYKGELKHYLTIGDKTEEKTFPERDQFAAEIVYFSECILHNRTPEPNGAEGMADVEIVEAINRSAATGQPVRLKSFVSNAQRPSLEQELHRPPAKEPEVVHAEAPTQS